MIDRVQIKNLRGIHEGDVAGLTPLSILVGPNGCGKSTVLDALLLGAAPLPPNEIGSVVRRREDLSGGARWVFWRDEMAAEVTVSLGGQLRRTCRLTLLNYVIDEYRKDLRDLKHPGPYLGIGLEVSDGHDSFRAVSAFADDNASWSYPGTSSRREGDQTIADSEAANRLIRTPAVRLLEPQTVFRSLHDAYSEAVKRGYRDSVRALLAGVIPGLASLEVLTEANKPILHTVFGHHSVPVAVAGDGIRALVRLACELAAQPGETILLEEPEVHQHPASLRQAARAILASVQRGVQVVLSTHSLDLMDLILAECPAEDIERLSLHRLALGEDGRLIHNGLGGKEFEEARGTIQDDLR